VLRKVQARAHEAGTTPVVNQHVVTRALLRRFTRPVPNNAQGLRKLNLLGDPVVPNFVPFASESMEDFWEQWENKFHAAFQAIDDGSLFSQPDQLAVIRDMVAVHYVRTSRVKQLHFASFADSLAAARAFWRRYPQIVLGFYYQQTGIVGRGPDAIERGLDLLFADTVDLVATGAVLRERMENHFTKVRALLDFFNIEIWTPATGAGEFLIGDAPAATVDPHSGDVGLAAGVGILGADVSVSMPLGPTHLAWVHRGGSDGFREIPADMVDRANAIQILAAEASAYARPGTSFETFADQVCRDRCYPPPPAAGGRGC
jgi:hypothetical protein